MLLKLNKEGPFKKDVFRAPGHQVRLTICYTLIVDFEENQYERTIFYKNYSNLLIKI